MSSYLVQLSHYTVSFDDDDDFFQFRSILIIYSSSSSLYDSFDSIIGHFISFGFYFSFIWSIWWFLFWILDRYHFNVIVVRCCCQCLFSPSQWRLLFGYFKSKSWLCDQNYSFLRWYRLLFIINWCMVVFYYCINSISYKRRNDD